MTRSRGTLRAALLIALLIVFSAQPAAAAVHKVSFTETVSPSGRASLTVAVSPRARCTIHGCLRHHHFARPWARSEDRLEDHVDVDGRVGYARGALAGAG